MPIIKSIPAIKIINGVQIRTSELAIVSEPQYTTNGEYSIVIRGIDNCILKLNSLTTDRVKIKAMTNANSHKFR